MMRIDICICTFRRPHIAATLRSIAALTLPENLSIRVIVADNDDHPSAQRLVEETAAKLDLALVYIHAPARNISIARNACLDATTAPLVAFIDDDELAKPDWLAILIRTMGETNADAVLGPVEAVYAEDSPAWMREADFHSTTPVWVDEDIITGYTCNVLFRHTAPSFAGLRFRPDLGRSGGEDTAFFSTAYANKAHIAFAPDAVVTEEVTLERSRFRWLLRRRFRSGQTHAMLLMEDKNTSRGAHIFHAGGKVLICFFVALCSILRPTRMKYWILRGTLHVGVVAQLVGTEDLNQYG